MTNLVYGFIEIKKQEKKIDIFKFLQKQIPIGITEIRPFQLSNFPDKYFYEYNKYCRCFCIGDKPGKNRASYLLDYFDYAKNADIGLPYRATDRLEILIDSILSILATLSPTRVVIAMTDSCEIENIKKVDLKNLKEIIISDFIESDGVPGTIYEVNR